MALAQWGRKAQRCIACGARGVVRGEWSIGRGPPRTWRRAAIEVCFARVSYEEKWQNGWVVGLGMDLFFLFGLGLGVG